MQPFRISTAHPRRRRTQAFTVVEALVALTIFGVFALGSTATLNFFETRAARNRNMEAARAVMDDYVNYVLDDSTPMPAVTTTDVDVEGDGTSDGQLFTTLGTRTLTNGTIPLAVTRTATPTTIVSATLYWKVQAVGKAFGLTTDTDLLQINFTLAYTYRGQPAYCKAVTFKAKT